MSVVLSKTVKEKIKSYHRYHGDTSIKIVKIVKDSIYKHKENKIIL